MNIYYPTDGTKKADILGEWKKTAESIEAYINSSLGDIENALDVLVAESEV